MLLPLDPRGFRRLAPFFAIIGEAMAFPGFPAPWHAVCLFWGNSPEFPHAYRSPLHGEARRVPVARFRGGAVFRHLRFRRHRHAVRRDRRDPRTVRPASLENHRGRMGAGCHLGPPVHGAADPAHRGSAGAAGRLSGHGSPSPAVSWSSCGTAARKASPSAS